MADRPSKLARLWNLWGHIDTAANLPQWFLWGKAVIGVVAGYPNEDLASKVTVRHLLTHTGGTGDIFGPDFIKNRLTLREHRDYVTLYGSRALVHEPGLSIDTRTMATFCSARSSSA